MKEWRLGLGETVTLREAVADLVHDGDAVALEGFTHLIPTAAAHEIVRQGRKDLTLIRMTPDLIYDQMIGMGCASKLVFSWGGNPGVGSLHRFRDAVERGWPEPLEIEEHSHAGMANRYVAGASNLPFAVLRGYVGTDLPKVTSTIAPITCASPCDSATTGSTSTTANTRARRHSTSCSSSLGSTWRSRARGSTCSRNRSRNDVSSTSTDASSNRARRRSG